MARGAAGTGDFMRAILTVLAVLLIAALPAAAQETAAPLDLTRQLIATGRHDAAAASAKAAFGAAGTDAERVAAARLAASAHFRSRQWARAELWLRIARQYARHPAELQAVAADFAGLNAASPWDVQLSFSIAPSSNINNGSQADTVTIWGLPFVLNPDARALSGWERSAGARLAYTVSESSTHKSQIGFAANARSYWLSPASAKAAPDVEGSDFAFSAAEVFASHSWAGQRGPASVGVSLGRNWYGGDPHTGYGRLRYSQSWQSQPGEGGSFAVGLERQIAAASAARSWIGSGELTLQTRIAAGGVAATIGAARTTSEDPLSENDAARLELRFAAARPVLGMGWRAQLSAEKRRWPLSIYDPAGREDVTVSGSVEVMPRDLGFFGFAPTVRLEARQTRSNISLFRRESVGLRLGLETQF